MDMSLSSLKVYYICKDEGCTNVYFEKEMEDLAQKFGMKQLASSMDLFEGMRDMAFSTLGGK